MNVISILVKVSSDLHQNGLASLFVEASLEELDVLSVIAPRQAMEGKSQLIVF